MYVSARTLLVAGNQNITQTSRHEKGFTGLYTQFTDLYTQNKGRVDWP